MDDVLDLRIDIETPAARARRENEADAGMEPMPNRVQLADITRNRVMLGEGSTSVVEEGVITKTGERVALKFISLDSKEGERQVWKEVRAQMRGTQCPHIVQCLGAFPNPGGMVLVTEAMDLGSLRDVLKSTGSVPITVLRKVMLSVLRGLDYIHRDLSSIHRDIKPSNVLLNSKGEVKIADFGLAKELDHSADNAATFVGTLQFMAPERFEPGRQYNSASDLWSLGVSCAQLATGKHPIKGVRSKHGFWQIYQAVKDCNAVTLRTGDAMIPDDFRNFVDRMLVKDPKQRATAQELLAHPWLTEETSETHYQNWVQLVARAKKRPV